MSTRDLLIQHLQSLQRSQQTHLSVSEQAKQTLRGFYRRARQGNTSATPSATTPAQQVAPQEPALFRTPAPTTQTAQATPQNTQGSSSSVAFSNTSAAPTPPTETLKLPSSGTAADRIRQLSEQASSWPPALTLGTFRKKLVFSSGNPEAQIMFVGDAPGFHEERQGAPFLGTSGEKLDGILKAMGLERSDVYLTTVCKFRPAMRNQTTNNRKPSPAEIAASLPFLQAEIDIIQPQVLVTLGASTAEALLNLTAPLDQTQGQWYEYQGIPTRVTQHPSYLMHSATANPQKRKVWEEMLAIMEKLKLPISEKQQGFFSKK